MRRPPPCQPVLDKHHIMHALSLLVEAAARKVRRYSHDARYHFRSWAPPRPILSLTPCPCVQVFCAVPTGRAAHLPVPLTHRHVGLGTHCVHPL